MPLIPPKTWRIPKDGNRPGECEDAFRVVFPSGGPTVMRAAVSDGASESAFSRLWAQTLVDAFVDRPLDLGGLTEESLLGWLRCCQDDWHAAVPWDRIPWHGEAKARAGSFATLLGLSLSAANEPGALLWEAAAVGDSCLFLVREDHLLVSFPLDDPARFDNNPPLVCSNPVNMGPLWDRVRRTGGECFPGDRFILASDALSAWFLARHASGEVPWETLEKLDASDRDPWVADQRRTRGVRNDDITLVIAQVSPVES